MENQTPEWVVVCTVLIFICAGLATLNARAADKSVKRARIQNFLGLLIIGGMTAICGWVAFDPGPKQFSIGETFFGKMPFSENAGRIIFGGGFIFLLFILIYMIKSIFKKRLSE